MYETNETNLALSPMMEKCKREKLSASELQDRKHDDWDDNYELYRNKVKTNRLTQRQAVNIPLMKETIKTLLSKIDEPPNVDWEELGGEKHKEIVYQELWNDQFKANNLELIDILDKKNVMLYGLSFKKLNISDKGVTVSVLDPYDILVDPLTNVWDLESARFIIHQNIFKPVRDILADDRYTEEGKSQLKMWADSPEGIIQGDKSREEFEEKMERLNAMGVDHGDFAYYAGGDLLINLTEHHTKEWDSKKKEFVRKVIVYANDSIELLNDTLENLIGCNELPFVGWSEDPEITDVYPDSIADLVRPMNKVLNVWYSQLIENRTLKNFQMHWYSPNQGYTPQTYTPGPGVMLPAPPGDDISKVLQPVEVSGLEDTLTAIQALTNIVERATGATAIEKGQGETGQQTLGEIQILVGKASERTVGMTKFYRLAWYEFAKKWDKIMQANPPMMKKLYKKSRNGKLYPKNIKPSDWVSKAGYEPVVSSTSEQETEEIKGLQKFQVVLQQFPENQALKKVAQKRMLGMLDITPEEMRMIEEAEDQQPEMIPGGMPGQPPQQSGQPGQAEVQAKLATLGQI